ncbi:MAG: bifunctional diaminohydroxyphosphoribosylaminopyrimidine deaminase/5-amino-6-(5-phosphoribosylamino)uracil reductase RibD, partial [Pedobacter sp.]|nr:bifunctional diaminohydroxyphosphoribosylaminopyrimidine deaminase/5-amino-6-(5-phosphoribosylamino)uracil reductase RibD [Pedobacter sp.]
AIRAVKNSSILSESTLYVNLEPCSHYGKTPPCADLIVRSKIPKVIIGTMDPNPKVAGRGIEIMRAAGIEVIVGVLENACTELNKRFFHWQNEHRPFVTLKWAQTKDGFVDIVRKDVSVTPLFISNSLTRQLTHKTRSENQAIMVSTNTAILDNPMLNVRFWSGPSPVRIVLDRNRRIPPHYQIYKHGQRTIVFTEKPDKSTDKTTFVELDFNDDMLAEMLKVISKQNIHSVLVEGGPALLNSFISSGLWDEVQVEISAQIVGDGVKAPVISGLPVHFETVGSHQIIRYANSQ